MEYISKLNKDIIFLDNNATTIVYDQIFEDYRKLLQQFPINASSEHILGRLGKELIIHLKKSILKSLNIENDGKYNVIITSSGTEANNMALRCAGKTNHTRDYLISSIEHKSILNTINCPTLLPVNEDGIVLVDKFESILHNIQCSNDVGSPIISIGYANGEIGVLQDIKYLAKLSKQYLKSSIFHTDCSQSLGKVMLDFSDCDDIDMVTISGHKIGAPQGIGALIYKKELDISPIILGGRQENNLRSGTENIFAIFGMIKALEKIDDRIDHMNNNVLKIRNKIESHVLGKGAKVVSLNADRIPNTSYIITPGVDNNFQITYFDMNGILVSRGSACSSSAGQNSHVLDSIGIDEKLINCGIRVSLSVKNTEKDVDIFLKAWDNLGDM